MNRSLPTTDILGVRFSRLTPEAALNEAETLFDSDGHATIAYANVHTVNLACADPAYRAVLNSADLVLNDGKGVLLAARLLGRRFPRDLNGNFFTPLLLERAALRGWRVFLMGGKPGIAARAGDNLERHVPGLKLVGNRDGYFSPNAGALVAEEIRDSGAELVLVALGNPKQEQWLHDHLAASGGRLGVGVGGFVDFQAGEVRRAPDWMNKLGLEWVHRLIKEPRRMWRRYIVGNPLFVARVLASRRPARKSERRTN